MEVGLTMSSKRQLDARLLMRASNLVISISGEIREIGVPMVPPGWSFLPTPESARVQHAMHNYIARVSRDSTVRSHFKKVEEHAEFELQIWDGQEWWLLAVRLKDDTDEWEVIGEAVREPYWPLREKEWS